MSTVGIKIGPSDHGRRMSLEEFEHAEGEEGHLYELSRGVVTVADVPKPRHLLTVDAIRRQFMDPRKKHSRLIFAIAGGMECKLLIRDMESERHPDLAVYMTPPPDGRNDDDVWSTWIPAIVVEVVSRSSRQRDYQEKPEEYLRLGIGEYWIVDADEGLMKLLERSRGEWREETVRPPALYKTRHLPGFAFSIARVLEAAKGS
jgi:Uma2 family endonuclease